VVDADERSGLATDIERLSYSHEEIEQLAGVTDEGPVRTSV
jgi:hypothetical protein